MKTRRQESLGALLDLGCNSDELADIMVDVLSYKSTNSLILLSSEGEA